VEEGGGQTSTHPFEQWRYRYIENIGTNIVIEFVDPTMSGEYHMTMDPSEKDALSHVPGVGSTLLVQANPGSPNHSSGGNQPWRPGEFERLEQYVKLQKPPKAKFKDLEAAVTETIRFNTLPMKARADFMRITDSTVMTNIALQFDRKDLQFQQKENISRATVNIYARITSMSRRVVNVFEDVVTVEVPSSMLAQAVNGVSVYAKSVPLPPGRYRLNIVAKDIVGGNMVNYEMSLDVPHFEEEKLASSSLILADLIERVPTRNIGSGQFVIGGSKVRPRIDETFNRDEKMGIYLQVYNFGPDEKTRKPSGNIEYEVVKNGSNQKVFDLSEDLNSIQDNSAQQVTVEKILPLKTFEPGQYTLKLKVVDKKRNQVLTPSATFTVK
jgi:hypothetical protein